MTESPSASSSRQVTLDLDQLYRDRAAVEERIARERRLLAGLDATIALVEERLGIISSEAIRPSNVVTARKSRPTHRAMLLQVLAAAEEPLGVRRGGAYAREREVEHRSGG